MGPDFHGRARRAVPWERVHLQHGHADTERSRASGLSRRGEGLFRGKGTFAGRGPALTKRVKETTRVKGTFTSTTIRLAHRARPSRRRHRRDTVTVAVAMCTESLGLLQGQHVRQLGRQPPSLQGVRLLWSAGARGCVQHPGHQRRILLCRHLRLNVWKFCG